MDEEKIGRQIQADGSCKINGLKYLKVANTVMGNGVEEATLIPFKEEEKKYVRFVTMGRCMPEKNHRNLILAVNRLLGEGVLCKLYIIGDGQERKELESLIEELGIQGQVLITGFVTNPFVILKECDCFVFPSFYEAQGLAVLEARLVGLPIIVSNYPAVESVLLEDKQFLLSSFFTRLPCTARFYCVILLRLIFRLYCAICLLIGYFDLSFPKTSTSYIKFFRIFLVYLISSIYFSMCYLCNSKLRITVSNFVIICSIYTSIISQILPRFPCATCL